MNFTVKIKIKSKTIQEGKEHIEALMKMANLEYEITHNPLNRSINQNSALHLYLAQLEDECRNMGYTMDMIIKKPAEIPITQTLLKDLFRLYAKKMYAKNSTSKLDKNEFSDVVNTFQRIIAQRLEISLPFPSIDNN